jgi:cell wall-associated NlpC family hydrolase
MFAVALVALSTSVPALAAEDVPAPVVQLPSASSSTSANGGTRAWQGAQDIASFALGLLGVDYRFGGNAPETGLDCSGLVRYVFEEVTGVSLPRTSKDQSRIGHKVALPDLMPGDLVFFNTRRFAFSHVGLYLGGDQFIHAPSRGGEVRVSILSDRYWKTHFDGARRLVGVLPSLVPTASAAQLRVDGVVETAAPPAAPPETPLTRRIAPRDEGVEQP